MGIENPPAPLVRGVSVGSESKGRQPVSIRPPNKGDIGGLILKLSKIVTLS